MREIVIQYFLWFLLLFGVITYFYTAFKNTNSISVNFFGTQKKIAVRNLILIVLTDGIILGMILFYLILPFFSK